MFRNEFGLRNPFRHRWIFHDAGNCAKVYWLYAAEHPEMQFFRTRPPSFDHARAIMHNFVGGVMHMHPEGVKGPYSDKSFALCKTKNIRMVKYLKSPTHCRKACIKTKINPSPMILGAFFKQKSLSSAKKNSSSIRDHALRKNPAIYLPRPIL